MKPPIRNRIVEHVQVRAGELVPHPHNFRRHPPRQKAALAASYAEVGFARSLLGYRLADGRIQLIDGHLRRDVDADMLVTVEVLDVSDEEARKLLLTLDPLTGLATTDAEAVAQLTAITAADSQLLKDLWQSLEQAQKEVKEQVPEPAPPASQFLVLVTCRDEAEQVELLQRFTAEGLQCRALIG